MIWLWAVVVTLALCFGGVLLVGAPYLPTLDSQVKAALELADLRKGQTLLELGCGDGKVLIAAARQGIKSVGYELNPLLAAVAWCRSRRYQGLIKVVWGDFWQHSWPPAEAIFTFLLPRYMGKLNNKIIQYPHKPVKLISFAFKIPERSPTTIRNGLYLYLYR